MKQIISVGTDFLPTKQNISDLSDNIAELATNGEIDVLKTAVQLEAIKKACEQAREKMEEAVLAELQKHGRKAVVLGAKVDEKEVGTKWDYSGSEAWRKAKEEEDKAAAKRKAVEAIAKNIPAETESTYTDTDTGETLSVVRGSKTSKTSFTITLGA